MAGLIGAKSSFLFYYIYENLVYHTFICKETIPFRMKKVWNSPEKLYEKLNKKFIIKLSIYKYFTASE